MIDVEGSVTEMGVPLDSNSRSDRILQILPTVRLDRTGLKNC